MNEIELAKEWYRYNAHVRRLYLNAILRLPQAEQVRDRGTSFPSLRDVFVHTLEAYWFWFHRVVRNSPQGLPEFQPGTMSPTSLRNAVRDVDRMVLRYLDSLRENDLKKVIHATFTSKGRTVQKEIVVRDMIWHMVEEEIQHRGELNAIFWQMDRDPPVYGWDDWKEKAK